MATKTQKENLSTALPDAPVDRSGLWLNGVVMSRRRRVVKLKNSDKVRYIIQLRIMANNEIITTDRWSDSPAPSDLPLTGAEFNQRVMLRIFQSASGTKVSLQWGDNADEGEF